jgi:hypothetical protein
VITSGFISLTTTNAFTPIFYLKNTDAAGRIFNIESIRVCGACSCEHTESLQCVIYHSPTGGTIVGDTTTAYAVNMNLGKLSNEFQGVARAGGEGFTSTGGKYMNQFTTHIPGHSIDEYHGALVLARGSSFVLEVKPSHASEICISIQGYYETYY